MAILVTGGTGYIGSHTCIELLEDGQEVIILDNLSNSKIESLHRINELTGKNPKFYQADIGDSESLTKIFNENNIEAVIHFAGLKAVGESVTIPLKYYNNNVSGTVTLCELMKKFKVKKIVFSSSATVYGNPKTTPISEDFPLSATNPYGRSKLMIEDILRDLYISDNEWRVALLRYFNPVGAHKSGRIGEDPNGIPNNLTPFITQVAVGKLPEVKVFGNDYDTVDGTGVRDYIHVVDLAKGHLKALNKINQIPGIEAYNLGTGTGYSVLQVINAYEKVCDKKIPYSFVARRPGDVAISYANPKKAETELRWKADKGLVEMCEDSWRWQVKNPNGY